MSNAPFVKLSKDLGPGSNKDRKNQSRKMGNSHTSAERTNSCSFQDSMEGKNPKQQRERLDRSSILIQAKRTPIKCTVGTRHSGTVAFLRSHGDTHSL